jgi:hypothetical protein
VVRDGKHADLREDRDVDAELVAGWGGGARIPGRSLEKNDLLYVLRIAYRNIETNLGTVTGHVASI